MSVLTAIILLLGLQLVCPIFIHREVQRGQSFCLSDDIPRHTLVKIDIKTEGVFKFSFLEGNLAVVTMDLNRMGFTKSLTTQRYGLHKFCFYNGGDSKQTVALQISIGSQANDFGSFAESDELMGALVNQGRIAEEFIQELVKQNTEGMEIMVHEAKEPHHFGHYFFFTLVFGLASMALTFVQYRVIQKHLHSRKYI